MSASLKTTNYELGIYAPNDVTSWLTDFNGNMDKIDAQMKTNADGVQGNVGLINSLNQRVVTAEDNIEQLEQEYGSLIQEVSFKSIDFTVSSNIETGHFGIIAQFLNNITGTIHGTINKNGDELSNINLGNDRFFVPLINITGNPFELETISSPVLNDLGYYGNAPIINIASSEIYSQLRAGRMYYNGTNTLLGVVMTNVDLESGNRYTSFDVQINYLISGQ